MFQTIRMLTSKSQVNKLLAKHFQGLPLTTLVTAARHFPSASRVDLEVALDDFLQRYSSTGLLGIHAGFGHETVSLAHLLTRGSPFPVDIGLLQHEGVDIGEPDPVRCLKTGLWLASAEGLPFAVLVSPSLQYKAVAGIQVEIGVPPGEVGWGAYARDLPGLGVVVRTLEETKQLIREVIKFHLEGMRQHGDLIPDPSSQTEYRTVA